MQACAPLQSCMNCDSIWAHLCSHREEHMLGQYAQQHNVKHTTCVSGMRLGQQLKHVHISCVNIWIWWALALITSTNLSGLPRTSCKERGVGNLTAVEICLGKEWDWAWVRLFEIQWDWMRLFEIGWDWWLRLTEFEIDWDVPSLRLIEIDWDWLRLIEIDWHSLRLIEIEWVSERRKEEERRRRRWRESRGRRMTRMNLSKENKNPT